MEILEELLGSKDHSIVKGKRTKRQRPSSSTLSSSGTTAPTSCDGGGGGGFYSLVTSPSTSISTNIEEDEDMANCLILLAQSVVSLPKNATTTTTKDSIYTYECKTCNRSFPSFQALGGHRAGHKKPKQSENDRKETPVDALSRSGNHEEQEEGQSHKNFHGHTHDRPKIHECSICGSEFSSGQALGGHMRRHRNPNGTRVNESSSRDADQKPRNIIALDLNLPAPAEDDHGLGSESGPETKFRFSSNHQGLVFSSVAMVDCHY